MKKACILLVLVGLAWCAGFFRVHEYTAGWATSVGSFLAKVVGADPASAVARKYELWDWRKQLDPLEKDDVLCTTEETRQLQADVILKRLQVKAASSDSTEAQSLRALEARLAELNLEEIDRRIAQFRADLEAAAGIDNPESYQWVIGRISVCLEAAAARRAKEQAIVAGQP